MGQIVKELISCMMRSISCFRLGRIRTSPGCPRMINAIKCAFVQDIERIIKNLIASFSRNSSILVESDP